MSLGTQVFALLLLAVAYILLKQNKIKSNLVKKKQTNKKKVEFLLHLLRPASTELVTHFNSFQGKCK